jgi:hypothetical protein
MKHKIAIITSHTDYNAYDDYADSDTVVNSITEWTEVSHEDFEMLKQSSYLNRNFFVVEQPIDPGEFVAKTVADYIEYTKAENIRVAKEAQSRKDSAEAKRLKKLETDKERKVKLLKKLQDELGNGL